MLGFLACDQGRATSCLLELFDVGNDGKAARFFFSQWGSKRKGNLMPLMAQRIAPRNVYERMPVRLRKAASISTGLAKWKARSKQRSAINACEIFLCFIFLSGKETRTDCTLPVENVRGLSKRSILLPNQKRSARSKEQAEELGLEMLAASADGWKSEIPGNPEC